MTLKDILLGLLFYSRFFVIIASIILPIILLIRYFYLMFYKRYKSAHFSFLGFLASLVLVFLVFGSFELPSRVDVKSIKKNKDDLLSIEYGSYEFDAKNIAGEMYVYEIEEFETIEAGEKTSRIYDVDDDTTCAVSNIYCYKDDRFSHMFSPMSSDAVILIENEKKVIEIYYWYKNENASMLISPITNPEIIYRPKIDVGDILAAIKPEQSGEQSGDGSMID